MIRPITALQTLQRFRADALTLFEELGVYEDGVAAVDFGVQRALVIGDPHLATAILTSPAFDKGRESYGPLGTFAGFGSLRWLIGPTLPVLDGPEGLVRRRTVQPVYNGILTRLAAVQARSPFPQLPDPGDDEFDLYPMVAAAIFHRFSEVMFGRPYAEHAAAISEVVSTATTCLDILSKSYMPYVGVFGSAGATIRRCRAALLAFAEIVYDDLSTLAVGDEPPPALLSLLSSGLSREEVLDEIVTQIVAGTETSSITTSWALSELIAAPEWLEALRAAEPAEAEALAGRCVREATRMYPAFWTMIRVSKEDVSLVGRHISANTLLFVSPFCIHHNPAFWPEPDRFDPDRFRQRRGVRGDHMPFGYGARACIGARLAHGIISETLLAFARQLDLRPGAERPVRNPLIVVLKSHTGFPCRASRRA